MLAARAPQAKTVSTTVVRMGTKTDHFSDNKQNIVLRACLTLYDILTPKFNFLDKCCGHGMSLTVFSHCDLDLRSQFLKKCIQSRSPILFMAAVPYFVCRYILGPG